MRKRLTADPGAALLLGFLLFSLSLPETAAVLTAALFHELGHLVAMRLLGVPVNGVRLTVTGPVLNCGEAEKSWVRVFCALAGPAAGVGLFFVVGTVWPICGQFSLLLSAVNLIPVLPLDGGRALETLLRPECRSIMAVFGLTIPAMLMAVGLFSFHAGGGLALTAFGGWLLLLACQAEENEVK